MERLTGEYVTTTTAGEAVRSFVPAPLPPVPPLQLEPLQPLLDRANQAIGRLDSLASVFPDAHLFLYTYVRKEAVLSSQIEGTQSSLSDLLLFESSEMPGVPLDDVKEVSCYVAAMQHGLDRIRGGFPISLRLIREMHEVLLKNARGSEKTPGEFRASQNWIGGTRPGNAVYVPPPPDRLTESLDSLEKFLHDDAVQLPLLVQLGLVHVQFESIHPFLDGNGRLGRLLITLLLCARGALQQPLLYLSLYFKTHRARYYELLQSVRSDGEWEEWLEFFLEGTEQTARQAADTAIGLLRMFEQDREKIAQLGRAAASAMRVHQYMQTRPLVTIREVAQALGISIPTATNSLEHLAALKIMREATGRKRGRAYVYDEYMRIISEGTAPIG